ncbi:MAG: hypothetical protein RBT45_08660, partial [Acholeplasmataceae bacterium]|nr:hypothetical protein [Acholeplasmataceae bacterium]
MKKSFYFLVFVAAFFWINPLHAKANEGDQLLNRKTDPIIVERDAVPIMIEDPDGGGVSYDIYKASGTIYYENDEANFYYPTRNVKVSLIIMVHSTGEYFSFDTFADENGYYYVQTSPMRVLISGQYTTYIKVSLVNDDFGIYKSKDYDGNYVFSVDINWLNAPIIWLTGDMDATPSNELIYSSLYLTSFNGNTTVKNINISCSNDFGKAVNIHQSLLVGFKYLSMVNPNFDYDYLKVFSPINLQNIIHTNLPISVPTTNFYMASDVTLAWGYYRFPVGEYINLNINYGGDVMFIAPNSWDSIDIVLHEMGHYVADQHDFSRFIGADHSTNDHHVNFFGKDIGAALAWSEGFADFFSVASQKYVKSNANYPALSVVDDFAMDYNIEFGTDISGNPYVQYLGENSEGTISMFLYDLIDLNSVSDTHDNVYIPDTTFFNYLNTFDPVENFSDFWNQLSISPLDTNYGTLLKYYKFSPVQTSPSNNSSTTTNSPTFSWQRQQDGSSLPT